MSTLCRRQNRKPVSVLTCHLSSRPTPRKRAGSPSVLADTPVYMVFLVLVPSPSYVATRRRELLPRGFTLTLVGRSVFCYGIHKITPICAFHSGMPSLSGLSSETGFSDKSSYLIIYIRASAPSCHSDGSSSRPPS